MPMEHLNKNRLKSARTLLKNAASIVVLTGAGISADSGIPTFRGDEGLWRNFRPEDLATPGAFEDNPYLVWEWYNWRRELIAEKSPNAAHFALARMERQCPSLLVITQNVDGLHEKAGSRALQEIHGNIWKVRCTRCGIVSPCLDVPIQILPLCTTCRGVLRPHVVWFGESLDPGIMERCGQNLRHCSVLLIIGTSGVVQPAASFVSLAKAAGAGVIEINTQTTPNTPVADVSLLGRASEIVPMLI
jgi:NAD-dependent deacetylase